MKIRLILTGLALAMAACHESSSPSSLAPSEGVGGTASEGNWIALAPGEKGLGLSLALKESDAYGMVVSFSLPGFYLDQGETANELWHQVQLGGQDSSDQIGFPDLPLKRLTFALPEGAVNWEVRLREVEVETLDALPGAHQLIKYRALLCAEKGLDLACTDVAALLVAPSIPDSVRSFCSQYLIVVHEGHVP